jgi:hypothetical protein
VYLKEEKMVIFNGGPFDDDGPSFPTSAGQGMGFEVARRLRESGLKSKKTPKQIIKEAEGVLSPARDKAKKKKMGPKPNNLRASGKKKRGAFGEAYTAAPVGRNKGVRVAESKAGANQRMYEALVRKFVRMGTSKKRAHREARSVMECGLREKAPAGWEGTVKHMKKHPEIDNPYALSNYMKDEGMTPHH